MALDYKAEMLWIYGQLAGDSQLLQLLGLDPAAATDRDKALHIQMSARPEGLAADRRILCFFPRPSRKEPVTLLRTQVFEFDVHVPWVEKQYAWDILTRVYELLNGKHFGPAGEAAAEFRYDNELGELATAPGYYCRGLRFEVSVITK